MAREGQELRQSEWSHHMSSRLQSPEQSQEPESLPLDIQSICRDGEVPGGQLLGGRAGLGPLAICPAASLLPGYSDRVPEALSAGQRGLASPCPSPPRQPRLPTPDVCFLGSALWLRTCTVWHLTYNVAFIENGVNIKMEKTTWIGWLLNTLECPDME